MKKIMKKLMAMTAALLMVISLLPATGAKAATETTTDFDTSVIGSITIHKTTQDANTPLAGAKFAIYQIVSFTTDTNGIFVVGSSQVSSIQSGTSIDKIDASLFTSTGNLANGTYTQYVNEITTDDDGNAVFNNLPTGIYLVKETETPGAQYVASLPFFVSIPSTRGAEGTTIGQGTAGTDWVYDITATPKNSEAGGTKEIVSGADSNITYVDEDGNASAKLGDTVSYKITTTSPAFAAEYTAKRFVISDTISGLTIQENTFDIRVGGEELLNTNNENYTLAVNADKKGFTITFTDAFMLNDNYKNKEVVVTYDAVVNDDAVIGTDANKNEATISFKNGSNIAIDGEPSVYVYGLQLEKNDKANTNTKLNGVEFELYEGEAVNSEKQITATKFGANTNGKFVTDANGLLNIKGLPAGTYTLKEVKTVSGYTLLANPITIVIDTKGTGASVATPIVTVDGTQINTKVTVGTGEYFKFSVSNQKGFSLPATGGMGTYLFTIGGLVIMAGAAIALISMRKKNRA